MGNLAEGLLWYLAFIFSMVVHEASHAFTALKLGDNTAYDGGQVTLDPIPHIKREPIGTIVVPILSFLVSGWMIGWTSAPYDRDWARTYPDRSAVTSLAGPLSNLLLVLMTGLAIRIGIALDWFYAPDYINFTQVTSSYQDGPLHAVAVLLSITFTLNIMLCIFNLIPLPPLDGSGIIPLFISKEKAISYLDFIHNTPMLFMGLFVAWEVFGYIFDPIHTVFLNLLYPGAGYH
ncbi:site-2 protease family protein [Pelobacter seleniigenes]|uniref:site-2 protease family protein n=1 Tax=Pelobacter seleniigenes TaxID=407188 RepID=UPI0004A719EE|nr:site-2 protease family protein [Pelobacter seleniigenes]